MAISRLIFCAAPFSVLFRTLRTMAPRRDMRVASLPGMSSRPSISPRGEAGLGANPIPSSGLLGEQRRVGYFLGSLHLSASFQSLSLFTDILFPCCAMDLGVGGSQKIACSFRCQCAVGGIVDQQQPGSGQAGGERQ